VAVHGSVPSAREFAEKIHDVHLKDTEILWHVPKCGGIQAVNLGRRRRFRVPGYGPVDWEIGYAGAMNIENADASYYSACGDAKFTEGLNAASAWRTNSSRRPRCGWLLSGRGLSRPRPPQRGA
jgi:sugar phosphate isomerase/epimerase